MVENELVERLCFLVEKYFQRIGDLLEQSERRIDQTNQMITSLAETEKRLTDTYAMHINNLAENRNEVINQNRELVDHNNKLMEIVERAQKMEMEKNKEHYELLQIIASLTNVKNNILKIDNKATTI